MNFNAKAVLLNRDKSGKWFESETTITSEQDIIDVFKPFVEDVTQVDLNKHEKIYYSICFLRDGIEAKTKNYDGKQEFMVAPLLLVSCDDEKPIDIKEEAKKSILDKVDFF